MVTQGSFAVVQGSFAVWGSFERALVVPQHLVLVYPRAFGSDIGLFGSDVGHF